MFLTGCGVKSPARETAVLEKPRATAGRGPVAMVTVPKTPLAPFKAPVVMSREISGIRFEGVAFDARSHRLRMADQAGGPGTRWADAEAAMRDCGGLAALNAGFFTPEGDPLGKVVTAGHGVGAWNRTSSLGSGVWLESAAGEMAIRRREAVTEPGTALELVQAGPLLIERGRAVSGLDGTKSSVRSLVLWDGGSRWWMGRASACTLAELGTALAGGSPSGWPVAMGLNLDGGRSGDLAVSPSVGGGPLVRRAPWNRAVRNFLVLVGRVG
jgi:hypothetical protein